MPRNVALCLVALLALITAGLTIADKGVRAATFESFRAPGAKTTFVDLKGERRTLGELRGKVVLLDFWATWCVPCKRSLPLYAEWQARLGKRGLQVVAVSVDGTPKELARFATDHAPGLTVWRDPDGEVAEYLDLPKMPTAYLVGRDGAIILRHVGFEGSDAAQLEARIVEALDAR